MEEPGHSQAPFILWKAVATGSIFQTGFLTLPHF